LKKKLSILLIAAGMATAMPAQVYNQMNEDGTVTTRDERTGTTIGDGSNGNFNPNRRDSVANKEIPRGVRVWTVDRTFGDIIPAEIDTMPHLYQNSIFNTGLYGEYNTTGNNYTPRQHRIVIDRPMTSEFFFSQPYDFMMKEPDEFLFVNTLSPYTHITYDNCGNQQNGEDHIDAKFSVNANKRLGMGFDLDYHYARGYFANQATSHFRASFFGSYVGDRYQMHTLFSTIQRKVTENGGITNDDYITHPESFDDDYNDEEIPTELVSNWNRNNSLHWFLSHRYNIGFYRKVKMTDEEIKARQFAAASAKEREAAKDGKGGDKIIGRKKDDRIGGDISAGRPETAHIAGDLPAKGDAGSSPLPTDTTRVKVGSQAQLDSLNLAQARQDSIDATMKTEYVPVTSIIHTLDINSYDRTYLAYATPDGYYADTFYDSLNDGTFSGDSISDQTKFLSIKNTFGIALLEGFNKYMKAGLKAFISHEYRRYQMPDLEEGGTMAFLNTWKEQAVWVGGQLSKTQGRAFHFNLLAEAAIAGADIGDLSVNFETDLNFPLFGDTVQLAAKAFFHRMQPVFWQGSFHSKHLWWDEDLSSETRTHLEGLFTFPKTGTRLRVAIEEIQNYTYFGTSYDGTTTTTGKTRINHTAGIYQAAGNINLMTLQLRQDFRLGIINWENIITYQNSSNQDALPVPALNLFSNLYLKFKIARVLSCEMGASGYFFTKYYAPEYVPQLSQYAVQQNADSRVELGGYPFVDVYANFHLKRARFFVMMSHINVGTGSRMQFLAPHYPQNGSIFRFGVSWNFFN